MDLKLSTDRILTTHTGSLPRPDSLMELIAARESGTEVDADILEAEVRGAVTDVVQCQIDAGIDIVNDGEQGRADFATYAHYRVTGFDSRAKFPGHIVDDDFPDVNPHGIATLIEAMSVPLCDGPVSYVNGAVQMDAANLTDAVLGKDVQGTFMTSVSPGEMSLFMPNGYYPSQSEYLAALVDAMREEYEAIHEAGHIVQLDAPDLALGFHTYYRGSTVPEFRRHVEEHVEAINAATANIPPEGMRLHICYGPGAQPHHRDVELRDVLDIILKARPAGLCFEGANCRHEHDWNLFRERFELPDGKYLIVGVLDVTTNRIEHPELIAERIVRLARAVGRENVLGGTDCGFRTNALIDGNKVASSVVWAKLKSLSEGAQIASEQLW
jgi:5-methyltetrahydropteroyltriglutamate--homocysteine methyltransferase